MRAPALTLGVLAGFLVVSCDHYAEPLVPSPPDAGDDTAAARDTPDEVDATSRDAVATRGDDVEDEDAASAVDAGRSGGDSTSDGTDAAATDTAGRSSPDGDDGTASACTTVVAACVVRGSDADPSNDLSVRPLEQLDCTASGASIDDARVLEYRWEVLEAPATSTSLPTPENGTTARFFVDAIGRYRLGVSVVDDRGCESPASEVSIVSRPRGDIYVDLTWRTPGDPDETDTGFGDGTDMDIHLLHQNGCWESPLWDCHFRARSPNWGKPGRRDDDPSLDIDDTDGAGPEVAMLNIAESGVTYRVAAHYYDDHGFGPSTATIRIFMHGDLVFEESKLMPRTDYWWVAAAVSWPSALVTPIDHAQDGVPSCAP